MTKTLKQITEGWYSIDRDKPDGNPSPLEVIYVTPTDPPSDRVHVDSYAHLSNLNNPLEDVWPVERLRDYSPIQDIQDYARDLFSSGMLCLRVSEAIRQASQAIETQSISAQKSQVLACGLTRTDIDDLCED